MLIRSTICLLLIVLNLNLAKGQELEVSTLAGSGFHGFADGQGSAASFYLPAGIDMDKAGNLYVGDQYNHRIRKITPAGYVSTFAGSGSPGSADGQGTAASFNHPQGISVDTSGNVFVADRGNHKIRKISPSGVVTTYAGSGSKGKLDGLAASASFNTPYDVAVDLNGNVYVADYENHKIRKISSNGTVSTLAGSGTYGYADGIGTAAKFGYPAGLDVDSIGNIYVADEYNHRIRKITPNGTVSTFSGPKVGDDFDRFAYPRGVTVAKDGTLYVADQDKNRIRKVATDGKATNFAGTGVENEWDGPASTATFARPAAVTVGANNAVYVADYSNHKIRKIDSAAVVVSAPMLTDQDRAFKVCNPYGGSSIGIEFFDLEEGFVSLLNCNGAQILMWPVSKRKNLVIDSSNLASGIYFIRVSIKQGVFTQKVLLTH